MKLFSLANRLSPVGILFLIAATSLAFEMLLIRTVFAVFTLGMTSSIVAVSSFGFGLGGLLFYLCRERLHHAWATTACLALASMATIYCAIFALLNHGPFAAYDGSVLVTMVLTTAFFAGPGFYAACLFSFRKDRIWSMYAFDLLGACVGVLFPLWALNAGGREATLIAIFLAILIGLAVCLPYVLGQRFYFVLVLIAGAGASGWHQLKQPFVCQEWRGTKEVNVASSSLVNINWISGPLDIVRRSNLPKIQKEEHQKTKAAYLANLDCRGRTMTADLKDISALKYSEQEVHSLPFYLGPIQKAAFFGTGLGIDILRGQYFGVKQIAAFEINPDLIALEEQLLGENSNYKKPNVQLYLGDSRRQLTLLQQKFDLIYISSSKNYGRVGVNANALLLNRMLTVEALETYFLKLNEQGLLYLVDDDRHSKLNVANYRALFTKLNIKDGWRHMAYAEDGSGYTGYLLSKSPFTSDQAARLTSAAEARKWKIEFGQHLLKTNRQPYTDDRPNVLAKVTRDADRGFAAFTALGFCLALGLIMLPYIRSEASSRSLSSSLFALFCSGILFTSTQIGFLYSLEILFDHPLHTVAFTLVLMFISSAIGSWISARLQWKHVRYGFAALIVFFFILFLTVNAWVHVVYEASLVARIMASILVIAPCSITLGMIFPLYLNQVSVHNSRYIPIGIGVNGMGILLGGIGATWVVVESSISLIFAINAGIVLAVLLSSLLLADLGRPSKVFSK